MSRVFTTGPGNWGSIPSRVIPKTKKNGTWCLLGLDVTPTRSRWISNNYIIRGHRQVQLVGVSQVGDKMLSREPAPSRGLWDLRTPDWAAQQNEKEVLLKTKELGVNMLQFVQSPTQLSHITISQPIRIKCERYIFLKKGVRSSLLLIVSPHPYVLCGYVTRLHTNIHIYIRHARRKVYRRRK